MCTTTWFSQDDAYEVFFNRDELRARKPALPPQLGVKAGRRFIAPTDGDFGGSWIAVNDLGLTLALLNGYLEPAAAPRPPADGFTSRGLLVTGLIDSRSAKHAVRRLQRRDLGRFRSFRLALFQPGGPRILCSWQHGTLRVDPHLDARIPLVSSSFATAAVCRERRATFRAMVPHGTADATEMYWAFHRSHRPQRGPSSTCMHRADARTVSFSHVRVDDDAIRFAYVPDSPCRAAPSVAPVVLRRAIRAGGERSSRTLQ